MAKCVIALGGNALIQASERGTVEQQIANAARMAEPIANLIADGWDVVITHGNGPQVGAMLRRVELTQRELPGLTLDFCDAHTQGIIGYILQQVIGQALSKRGVRREIASIITQVEVNRDDPAFDSPKKPIGRFYEAEIAEAWVAKFGWVMAEDVGRGWRRVVASPKPVRILELETIKACLAVGTVPIACGGGGIPVAVEIDGSYSGVEAVIDKDRTSSLVARELPADLLVILTAVPAVQLNFGTSKAIELNEISTEHLRKHLDDGAFAAGSMRPKVEAVLHYLEKVNGRAIITNAESLVEAVAGRAGTRVA